MLRAVLGVRADDSIERVCFVDGSESRLRTRGVNMNRPPSPLITTRYVLLSHVSFCTGAHSDKITTLLDFRAAQLKFN